MENNKNTDIIEINREEVSDITSQEQTTESTEDMKDNENEQKLSVQHKLIDLIKNELLDKSEEDIKNMSSEELERIIGVQTMVHLKNQAKRNHMGKARFEEMKRDFVLMLKRSFEGDNKYESIQRDISEVEKKFNEEIKKAMEESQIDVPELIVDLCSTKQYQNIDDKDANFKLYIRGLKWAGDLENISKILKKYKFKVLFNFYKKSFEFSKDKVFKLLEGYKHETFHDPRLIPTTLIHVFSSEHYHEEVFEIFSLLFYMLFDNIKDNNKFPLDLLTFSKYFLLQLYYLSLNESFKSRELFTASIKNILDQIETDFLSITEVGIHNMDDIIKKDKEEILELKKNNSDLQ